MAQLGSHWKDFHETWYLSIFSKIHGENESCIEIGQEERAVYKKTNTHL
jgi:hypothetical protein